MTVSNETDTSADTGVILTDSAAAKAKALLDQEGRDDLALRIADATGWLRRGCATSSSSTTARSTGTS